jgi:hypothetical protein
MDSPIDDAIAEAKAQIKNLQARVSALRSVRESIGL